MATRARKLYRFEGEMLDIHEIKRRVPIMSEQWLRQRVERGADTRQKVLSLNLSKACARAARKGLAKSGYGQWNEVAR